MNKFFIPLLALLLFGPRLAAQTDTVPPYLRCKDFVNASIGPSCSATLWAGDLVDSLSDNFPGSILLGIRKRCTGSGFPENRKSIDYTVPEAWEQRQAEVWARDGAGNTASCMVHLLIVDYLQNCDPTATIQVTRPDQSGVGGVTFVLSGQNCVGDTIPAHRAAHIVTNNGLWYEFGWLLETGFTSTLKPSKMTAPLNGITAFDLSEIQRHILGISPFDAPWKIIAADANLDGKVTLQDVVLLQKLLLGHIAKMPHGQSWRFYPKNHVFTDTNNPFLPALPGAIATPNTADPAPHSFQFIGVKIGDVNGSANPGQ
jgi:hypothetical protein